MQKDIRATFGGLFGAEQLKFLSDLRLPFRLVFDHLKDEFYYSHDYERVCQKSLHVTNNGSLKLTSIPSSTSNTEDFYLLETSDGTFLDVSGPIKSKTWIDFMILTSNDSSLPNPKSSFICSILPQPDGRILMQSKQSGKFIRASLNLYLKEEKIKLTMTDDLFDASKFLLEPVGDESVHQEWCFLFGGSIGLKKIGQLLNNRLPFFLSAVQENYRFYVNVQKIVESFMDNYFQAGTNTLTLLEGNSVDGTNCLLHSASGQYLCVLPETCYLNGQRDHLPCLATSPLDFDAVKGTPQQNFLFDFVPRSADTFAIRSHYNGKFVRCVDKLDDLRKIFYGSCTSSLFPVDATLETATEFVISSPPMTSLEHKIHSRNRFTIRRFNY